MSPVQQPVSPPTTTATNQPKRSALLVGSLPFASDEACMKEALDALGPMLFCLPDGEVGEKTPSFPKGNRIAWVVYAIEKLTQDTDSWQIVKEPIRGAMAWQLTTTAFRNSNRAILPPTCRIMSGWATTTFFASTTRFSNACASNTTYPV